MNSIGIEHIQILALASVEDPDWKQQYRQICRWYSREFSTPLRAVELELDQLHVLTHYYEDSLSKLYNSESEQGQVRYGEIRDKIMKTQMSKYELEELDVEDDNWADQMIKEIAENVKEIKQHKEKVILEAKKVNSAESLKNPNLEEDIEFSVRGESGPPEY